jgi:hypothetical protein
MPPGEVHPRGHGFDIGEIWHLFQFYHADSASNRFCVPCSVSWNAEILHPFGMKPSVKEKLDWLFAVFAHVQFISS